MAGEGFAQIFKRWNARSVYIVSKANEDILFDVDTGVDERKQIGELT